MNIAVTQRSHMQVPWVPMIATLAAVVVAIIVLVVINQPATTTSVTAVSAAPAFTAAEVAKPETPAVRRVLSERLAVGTAAAPFAYFRNHVQGTTLGSTEAFPPTVTRAREIVATKYGTYPSSQHVAGGSL